MIYISRRNRITIHKMTNKVRPAMQFVQYLIGIALLIALIMSLFKNYYARKNPILLEPVPSAVPTVEPASEPKVITLPDGSSYPDNICEQFKSFKVTLENIEGRKEIIICPVEDRNFESTPSGEVDTTQGLQGNASYYSIAGCLGCSADLKMANGQILDDTKLTLAHNQLPLNSKVTVTNLNNGLEVIATVTDRGGFERHGKIADLSLATKNSLGCGDVCKIAISKI